MSDQGQPRQHNSRTTTHFVPGVLSDDDRLHIQRTFGAAAEQVARDHVISHALAAISSSAGE